MLREVLAGDVDPELRAYDYDPEMWSLAMEWVEDHASIALLRWLKANEPPPTELQRHEAWERTYTEWADRFKGFGIARAAGKFETTEVVYFVAQLFERIEDFSAKGLRFLRAKPREHLGEAERPPEMEVVFGDPDA